MGDGAEAERWGAVDRVSESLLPGVPKSVEVATARCAELGLPEISVTASMGRLLNLLARLVNARRVLEIGTLGGYSTAWLAEGLAPGGEVVTVEVDPDRARAAEETFRKGGIDDRTRVIAGAGLDVLPGLCEEPGEPFDLVFIDADKENSAAYADLTMPHIRGGGVIVVDNVVREGAIADPGSTDPGVRGSRDAIGRLGGSKGGCAAVLQTVGLKGYDGFAIAMIGR